MTKSLATMQRGACTACLGRWPGLKLSGCGMPQRCSLAVHARCCLLLLRCSPAHDLCMALAAGWVLLDWSWRCRLCSRYTPAAAAAAAGPGVDTAFTSTTRNGTNRSEKCVIMQGEPAYHKAVLLQPSALQRGAWWLPPGAVHVLNRTRQFSSPESCVASQ
jgi:hypothetical protein